MLMHFRMNTRALWVSSLSLRSSANGRREAHNALLQLVKCDQRHVHTGEQTGCTVAVHVKCYALLLEVS
jgi:hypothetical protein